MNKYIQKINSLCSNIDEERKQFKSIFNRIKSNKPDENIFSYDFKIFRHTDIVELQNSIDEKLKLLTIFSELSGVIISLSNKEIKSFRYWSQFKQFSWNMSTTTNNVIIEWNFNLLLHNQSQVSPHTFTLNVRIGQTLKPYDMIQISFKGFNKKEIKKIDAKLFSEIEKLNSQISDELKIIVSDWLEKLEKKKDNDLMKFILKHKIKINNGVIFLFIITGIVSVNFITHNFISKIPDDAPNYILKQYYLLPTCSFIVLYVFYILGSQFIEKLLNKRIRMFRRNPEFEFTEGDFSKNLKISSKNKGLVVKYGVDLLIAIAINFMVFLFCKTYS